MKCHEQLYAEELEILRKKSNVEKLAQKNIEYMVRSITRKETKEQFQVLSQIKLQIQVLLFLQESSFKFRGADSTNVIQTQRNEVLQAKWWPA